MTNRRVEIALVALLVTGCVGAILFVFFLAHRPGGGFSTRVQAAATTQSEARSRNGTGHESPLGPPVAVLVDPEPNPDPDPELRPEGKADPPKEAVKKEAVPKKAVQPDPYELAELSIELLVPADDPERLITAMVLDEQGLPVEDALVVFRSGSFLLYRERADVDGRATFMPFETETGPFRVDALAEGFVPDTARAVTPGATTELILKGRPVVEGVVEAPSRGHGTVKLFTADGVRQTRIEADGTFSFEELEEGQVTVQAEVTPYGTDSFAFYLEGGTRRFVRLRIRKQHPVKIYGAIRGWPSNGSAWINDIRVAVSPAGDYRFDHAVIGINVILIDAPHKALFRHRFQVRGLESGRYDFRLKRERTIRGHVRDARTRRPVPNAEVRLGVEFGDPKNERVPLFPVERVPVVRTDADGRYRIGRLDSRLLYLVSVVAEGWGQALEEGVVPGGGQRTIMLPEGPYLYGKLRGLGGVPKGAVVTARRLEITPNGRRFNVPNYDGSRGVRDRKGYFGLSGLIPGTYLVRVDAERYGSIETVIDLNDSRRVRIDLRMRRGQNLDDRDAELLRRLPPVIYTDPQELSPAETTTLRIDARREEHEQPLPGVRVSFWEDERELAPRMEFTELEFELIGLPEGSYRAVLTHPSLAKPLVREKVTLKRGELETVVLR